MRFEIARQKSKHKNNYLKGQCTKKDLPFFYRYMIVPLFYFSPSV